MLFPMAKGVTLELLWGISDIEYVHGEGGYKIVLYLRDQVNDATFISYLKASTKHRLLHWP